MRVTTGIDVIEIERIAGIIERYPKRFVEKVFTEHERQFAKNRPPQLAARFAAKEAVMKLLGTGIRGVPWQSIEVFRTKGKAPQIILYGNAREVATAIGINSISISLSHSKTVAVASVVAIIQ